MASNIPEPKTGVSQEDTPRETTPPQDEVPAEKKDILHSEVLTNANLMNDAFDGENREHEQGLWESAKNHPWACFWAFIMCFTIVSHTLNSMSTE